MILFTCEGNVAAAGELEAFVITVQGDLPGDQRRCTITIPVALADVSSVDRLTWDSFIDAVRHRFADELSPEQTSTLEAVAHIYSWFSRGVVAPDGPQGADELMRLWDELVDLSRTAVVMGMSLDTPGEDLLFNLELWGRRAIPDAFPDDFDPADPPEDE